MTIGTTRTGLIDEVRNSKVKARAYIHTPRNLGERLADDIATGMGSWKFIIGQSIFVGLWILLNLVGIFEKWDPYPFILLNLLFSTQAAYAAPIIMMSQNRQSQKDRLRDDHEAEEVDLLYRINEQQLEILALLRANICPEDGAGSSSMSFPMQTPPTTKPQIQRKRRG